MITIKYNNGGVQQWQQQFKGSNNFAWDVSNAVAVDTLNNVYVAGYTTNASGNTDYTVIKYNSGNTVAATKTVLVTNAENSFSLYQNTPNPSTGQTTISFKIKSQQDVSDIKLWLEDVSGKLIAVLFDKKIRNGIYQVRWNTQHVTPGVYYYRLSCNQLTKSGRLVVVH